MERRLPFQGVKVVEWTQAINGPWVGAYLADFGAEVIKIESTKFPEMSRTSSPYKDDIPGFDRSITFNCFNSSKRSFTVNLRHPQGREIFMKLVAWADIVLQNQRPGLMKQMAFGYDELKKVKEDISSAGVNIIRLSPADSKEFYIKYRNAMWEEDIQRWPDIAPKLKNWLVNPAFSRAN